MARELAANPEVDKEIRDSALIVLVRQRVWRDSSGWFVERLGLEQTEDGFTLRRPEAFTYAEAGLLYELSREAPREFAPAVRSLIRSGDTEPVYLFLASRVAGISPGAPEVAKALRDRIIARQTPSFSETESFDFLAQLAPET